MTSRGGQLQFPIGAIKVIVRDSSLNSGVLKLTIVAQHQVRAGCYVSELSRWAHPQLFAPSSKVVVSIPHSGVIGVLRSCDARR